MKKLAFLSIVTLAILGQNNTTYAANSASVSLSATVEQTAEIQNVNTAINSPTFTASELGQTGVTKIATDPDVKLFDNNAAGGIKIDTTSDYTTTANGTVLQNTNDPNEHLQLIADLTPCGAGATTKTITPTGSNKTQSTSFTSTETQASEQGCSNNPGSILYTFRTLSDYPTGGTYQGRLTYMVSAA
jgi:hypothetical protein